MIENLINTLKRLSSTSNVENDHEIDHNYSKSELIQWACGCMQEGLPDSFYEAYVEYEKISDSENKISHMAKISETQEYEEFDPADHLYPAQCIEHLDKFLHESKRNWLKCKIIFSTAQARIEYEY